MPGKTAFFLLLQDNSLALAELSLDAVLQLGEQKAEQ